MKTKTERELRRDVERELEGDKHLLDHAARTPHVM